jgi:hypothetical protein
VIFISKHCLKTLSRRCIMADSWPSQKVCPSPHWFGVHNRPSNAEIEWILCVYFLWWGNTNSNENFNLSSWYTCISALTCWSGEMTNCISASRHTRWVWSEKLYYALCFYGKMVDRHSCRLEGYEKLYPNHASTNWILESNKFKEFIVIMNYVSVSSWSNLAVNTKICYVCVPSLLWFRQADVFNAYEYYDIIRVSQDTAELLRNFFLCQTFELTAPESVSERNWQCGDLEYRVTLHN